ncbi:ribonuclease D [Dokdonella sp.]|uniref:ribonuclease D n=1 Tax=Dokdonella sp. TaxID=2291710 RepID=UPI0031BBF452|nr:ribonuclease D [Dokdonella sp.]
MADWIATDDTLASFLDAAPASFGLDTEFMRIDTYAPRLALVQLGLGADIGLVDPLGVADPAPLARLLGDSARTCVMHSAGEDLQALATWSCSIAHLFDTQIAASFAGLGAGLGYQKLVQALTGVELPKGQTRSDWLRRPLSPAQLDYAAQDVVHLPQLHAELAARVDRRGFSAWLAEDCQRLLDAARDSGPDPEPQTAFRGAADWPRERQALLRRLLLWREATARAINRPRPWLLDDAHVLDLAARPPRDAHELTERTRGQRALRSAQRNQLLDALKAPLRDDELEFHAIPPAPDARDKQVIAAMKQVVAARAAELDLPEGLLCSRRHLERLLATGRWPAALEGWRRDLLHERLIALLPD